MRASLSAAQASFKTPHPPPSLSASLASALFSSTSPLFNPSNQSANKSSDVNNTSPANPETAPKDETVEKQSPPKDLAEGLARTLEIPLGLKLEKASLRWAGWESTTSYAGSDAAPEGGYEAFVTRLLDEAKGVEVKLSSEVATVKQGKDTVTVSTHSGEEYESKTVLCTIPLGVLKTLPELFFTPALPAPLQEIIKGTHVGTLEKLLLHYPSAWWPNPDKTGSYTFLPTTSTPTENSSLEEIFSGSTLVCANFAAPSLPQPTPTLLTYLSETPVVFSSLTLRKKSQKPITNSSSPASSHQPPHPSLKNTRSLIG